MQAPQMQIPPEIQTQLDYTDNIQTFLESHLDSVCNVATLTEDEYAIVRKDSFGASDASILCNVNIYKTKEQLIADKRNKTVTDEDREISKKVAVRKGKDLEPLVLRKFFEATGLVPVKPPIMFKHKEYPYLTTNFDGVVFKEDFIPAEAKVVTKYGEKYYNKFPNHDELKAILTNKNWTIEEHIEKNAAQYGIPAYYYTQVQQQILFLDSEEKECPYGYLAALFDDSWDFVYYMIPRDNKTISHIIAQGAKAYEKIIC